MFLRKLGQVQADSVFSSDMSAGTRPHFHSAERVEQERPVPRGRIDAAIDGTYGRTLTPTESQNAALRPSR